MSGWGRHYKALRKASKGLVAPSTYTAVKTAEKFLLSPSTLKAAKVNLRPSTGKVLKATALGRYLDQHYEKKCGVEIKRTYVHGLTPGITTGFTYSIAQPLNTSIPLGTAEGQRIGTTIEVVKLKTVASFFVNPAATTSQKMRLMLVKLGKNAGGFPLGSQILNTPTDIRSIKLFPNDITEDYRILCEHSFKLSAASGMGLDRYDWSYTYVPKGCHKITWNDADTTGALANVTEGQILLYWMYEDGTFLGANQPTCSINQLLEYTDV